MEKYILIVDDQQENRDLLSAYCRKKKIDHLTACSGNDCIDQLHKRKDIKLILMDIKMDGMSGTETMKIIKSRYSLPVIAITGLAMEDDMQNLLNEGFDDYISKPIDIHSLWERINNFL